MDNNQPPATTEPVLPHVYKIDPELATSIYTYLQTLPMVVSDTLCREMFETGNPDPVYTEEGINRLVSLLQQKCARKDALPFLQKLETGGLKRFRLKQSEGSEPKESGAPA